MKFFVILCLFFSSLVAQATDSAQATLMIREMQGILRVVELNGVSRAYFPANEEVENKLESLEIGRMYRCNIRFSRWQLHHGDPYALYDIADC